MKRTLGALLSGLTSLGLLIAAPAPAAAETAINVGVLAPLTGRNAVQGTDILRGIKLATQRINSGYAIPMKDGSTVKVGPKDMGGKLDLVVQDTESRPTSALAAARKLVNVNKVPIVLGVLSSGVCVPTGDFTNQNKTVQIAAACTSPQLRKIGPYFFDVMGLDQLMGQNVAKFAAKDSGQKHFASFVANNPFGVGMEIQTCDELKKMGDECTTTVRYRQGKSDYRPELRRVLSQKPKAAFFVAYGTDARLILQQAYQLGIDPSLWYAGYPTLWSNEIKKMPQVGEGIKGLVVGSSGKFYDNEYAKAYEKEFGEPPTTAFGAYAYDSTMLAALAIKKAGNATPDGIRDALTPVAVNYKGVTGGKAFDKDGMQLDESYQEVIYHDGKLVPYKAK